MGWKPGSDSSLAAASIMLPGGFSLDKDLNLRKKIPFDGLQLGRCIFETTS
jgi:hypothetical protein